MGKWQHNTYITYGNIWAFLRVAERGVFALHGIFSVPLPFFFQIPESVRMFVPAFLY